ncbi:MarR family winged helix-turn-helix transcriptional regulator [Streptomyces sp. H27-D2]|uniref:MarR family winged helix-turn-helix transcriptional regulator n=1 Tax=Streptomyces sp. H27-D2 TaxID=3046304 RepID=UPI002DBCC9AE|nr:MarR family transcriptional regulator [Streptomyces sp. H27-D2]MEC4020315.1 MarR family transcriptional regulator [Streptomyces sp. H27-D2]
MFPSVPSHEHDRAAHAACAVSELLEVLWGRGQEAVPTRPVSPSQLRALLMIEQREGTNLRTLSEALGSQPPSVRRLCDRLEAVGLVVRSPSATSRREVELRLTRSGHGVLADFRDFRVREVETVLQAMTPAGLAALAEGLDAFRSAASAHVGWPAGVSRGGDQVADSA